MLFAMAMIAITRFAPLSDFSAVDKKTAIYLDFVQGVLGQVVNRVSSRCRSHRQKDKLHLL